MTPTVVAAVVSAAGVVTTAVTAAYVTARENEYRGAVERAGRGRWTFTPHEPSASVCAHDYARLEAVVTLDGDVVAHLCPRCLADVKPLPVPPKGPASVSVAARPTDCDPRA